MISTSHFHPMLVHFPIALIVMGFIAELLFLFLRKENWLSTVGFYLLLVGTLSALLAWATGLLFTSVMSGSAGIVKETHSLFAWISLALLMGTSLIQILIKRKKIENVFLVRIAFFLYAIATISVAITGFYGGTLVYNYMMPL
jgi:uncharacterized membrane protein